ncbi:MAG: hypothetical protein FK731_15265 [Asgard group archaeon]|nr:hypothetical protein [Asgard group archaeon]
MFNERINADPLIIFRCKNKQCRHIFTPSTLLIEAKQKLYFECPLCGSQYEAKYTLMKPIANHEVITLQEKPRLVHLGTRIASS